MKSAIASALCLLLMQSSDFQDCNILTPGPPQYKTSRDVPGYQVLIDRSREALINARNECNVRRAINAEMIKKLEQEEGRR